MWKLEPLSEERKSKWQREMDWLLSPTNYMVELVPAKQSGANGGMFEVSFISARWERMDYFIHHLAVKIRVLLFFKQIMTPKARADIHMNLPALQKLDSMLIVCNLFIPIKDLEHFFKCHIRLGYYILFGFLVDRRH